tara:strand:+ start:201 stop:386 length:186 start_codon:yes stop_codon:yes gene_type:complete
LKFKLSSELIEAAGKHAAQRGMTLEEYIQEFLGILQDEQAKGNVELDSKSIQDTLQTYSKL